MRVRMPLLNTTMLFRCFFACKTCVGSRLQRVVHKQWMIVARCVGIGPGQWESDGKKRERGIRMASIMLSRVEIKEKVTPGTD